MFQERLVDAAVVRLLPAHDVPLLVPGVPEPGPRHHGRQPLHIRHQEQQQQHYQQQQQHYPSSQQKAKLLKSCD